MKNIFLLPTNEPSKLVLNKDNTLWFNESYSVKSSLAFPQHLYITSDEYIDKDSWVIHDNKLMYLVFLRLKTQESRRGALKIILTTDPKLIDDGVQSIDEDFLKWLIKNPNCNFVEVGQYAEECGYETDANGRAMSLCKWVWRITTPQEVCNGSLSFLYMVSTITEEYECVKCGQKYRHSAKNGSQNFFPLTRCTKGVPPNPLDNLVERFKRDMSMVVMPLDNENIPEEEHSYLQGFIDQFGTGVLGELDPNEWDALQFLEWLKLNNYEIIKKN